MIGTIKSSASYEWCVEYVDSDGDIQDHDRSEKKADVWPPQMEVEGCQPRLCVIRDFGNEDDSLLDRGYAYFGDSKFCSGHAIPKHLEKQINNPNSIIK